MLCWWQSVTRMLTALGPRPPAVRVSEGRPRRGMSVVAALSTWLVHSNRRSNGSWTQRYERGIPVTDLAALADDGPPVPPSTSDPTLLSSVTSTQTQKRRSTWPPP